nr:alpha-amylase family glycosyl hydrolase [Woeseiaceae bacterium]
MNATSNFGTDDLIGHLAAIYGQREAGEIVKHIDALVLQYRRAARGIPTRPDLSEKDVALITYADTLRTEGVPPLRVLLDFHEQYLKGVFDVVHILPFQPYTSDDGFAVVDYHAVRSDLGDWEDVSRLSRVCSVMADAVVNHMSSEAPWFLGFLENDSDYAEYFVEEDPNAD